MPDRINLPNPATIVPTQHGTMRKKKQPEQERKKRQTTRPGSQLRKEDDPPHIDEYV